MNDISQKIIELDQQRARLSFQIKNPHNPINARDLELLQLRDNLKAQIETLAATQRNKLPDYTPKPRMEKMVINPRDLILEHNTRFMLARLAVSMMKIEYKWSMTYYD